MKITKNVIFRKLKRIEQSYLEARFAILASTLIGPNYRVENLEFQIVKKYIIKLSENFFEKTKTSYLKNYKDLNSHIWREDLQLLREPRQHPTTGLRTSYFEKYLS